jgi:hypothetical protein
MTTSADDHFDPYHSLYGAPMGTQWPSSDIPMTFGSQTVVEPPPSTKKSRSWMILILPAILLFVIAALLCFMLLWLLYRDVNFDPSFASMTNGALILDEAAQWCQMLAIAGHASCDSNQAPNLLGLTLSGLMVRLSIHAISQIAYVKWSYEIFRRARSHSVSHIS